MKRILSICLSLLLLASALTSCKPEDESPWKFEYKLEKSEFMRGETIRITATVTNNGKDYSYTGSPTDLFGPAKLYSDTNINYTLDALPFTNTDDTSKRIFETGGKAEYTYEFYTYDYTKEGAYTLEVPFGNETTTFQRVIFVKAPLTDEERSVIELADAEILKKYPIESLDNYQVSIDQGRSGEFFVRYNLMIGNYRTYESYTVKLNADKTVKNVYGDYGEYAVYLPYATEDKIREAEEKLGKQLEKYDESSSFYLSIDNEGYLCLNAEIIIRYEGFFEGGGCGIDHDHKFFSERICSLP